MQFPGIRNLRHFHEICAITEALDIKGRDLKLRQAAETEGPRILTEPASSRGLAEPLIGHVLGMEIGDAARAGRIRKGPGPLVNQARARLRRAWSFIRCTASFTVVVWETVR